MKKLLSVALACLTAGALFIGCGSDNSTSTEQTKIGMLAGLNISEQKYAQSVELQAKKAKLKLAHGYVFYDNLNGMIMALKSGDISELSLYNSVADYMVARNPEFRRLDEHKFNPPLKDKFCCAVKSDNKELLDAINGAIDGMKKDGTLDALTKKYITELKGGEEPEAVELPKVEGADTVKVAVTGDLPPLDLITSEGKPAGFNTAVLAEISKRIGKNFELVSVDSSARASALASGKVNMIFWMRLPNDDSIFNLKFDCPDGVEPSEHYFVDEIIHVGKK